jgi:molybdopterin-guanine dinucleotide biosynthesis protein A
VNASPGDAVGLVLAGGRSRRFPGIHKALQPLGDRLLIERVLNRFTPQVSDTWLSVGPGDHPFAGLGLRTIPDDRPRFRGPLAGLASGLEALAQRVTGPEGNDAPGWLVLAPCDAPFLPRDLVARLLMEGEAGEGEGPLVIVPEEGGQLQPTFSAWRPSALPKVRAALLDRDGPGLIDVLRGLPHRRVPWQSASPPPFFNVNTAADLDTAARWLRRGQEPGT